MGQLTLWMKHEEGIELNVEARVGIYQVREEGMSMSGRRTCTYKGIWCLAYSGTDKKLNIDGLWGWNGKEETAEVRS